MKTLVMGFLLAAGFVWVAGCHWHNRHWRDYRDGSYGSYYGGDRNARDYRRDWRDRDS